MPSGDIINRAPRAASVRPLPIIVLGLLSSLMLSAPVGAYAPGSAYHPEQTARPMHQVALPEPPRWISQPNTRFRQRGQRRGSGWRAAAQRYALLIEQASNRYSVEAPLIHAVIRAESGYNPKAVSPKGAAGLMQLMPRTARRYGVRNRFDPGQNIDGGVRYLRDLLARFKYRHLALAAYNAGEHAVNANGNVVPPYAETKAYVKRVMRFYRLLKQSALR